MRSTSFSGSAIKPLAIASAGVLKLISTGSGGGVGHSPFFRFYGPDLAGIFIGDAGALGIKARFTLRYSW